MRLANPEMLLLLLLVIACYWFFRKKIKLTTIKFSNVSSLRKLEYKPGKILIFMIKLSRVLALILIVVALARPQGVLVQKEILSEGIDIILAVDTSLSMSAEDFKPKDRLFVAKKTIKEFIKKREADRIGLVVFGQESYAQSPLTNDYNILYKLIDGMEIGMVGDGTAIGLAIASSLNRLKYSKAKSRVIILLTDGENTSGDIEPGYAAELASQLGIKIYTIGVGKEGGAPIPFNDPVLGKQYIRYQNGALVLTKINEQALISIAKKTKGMYFRATDNKALKDIYETINKLEKTKLKTKKYVEFNEFFPVLLVIILGCLLVEIILTNIIFLRVP